MNETRWRRRTRPPGIARTATVLLLSGLAACTAAATRPEPSTLGCAQTVVREHLPASLDDKQAHCRAAGLIARYCSPAEATLTAVAKEFRDLFTAGDAAWADWRADRAGIRCAARASSDDAVATCCADSIELGGGVPE